SSEGAGGGRGVDVAGVAGGLDEPGGFRHVGDDAPLDLRVVCGEEHRVGAYIAGYEGAPDLLAKLPTDGDVHQVRVAGGEAAGRCAGLVELRVDAARLRVDKEGQCVEVG